MRLTQTALAKELGCTRQNIKKFIDKRVLKVEDDNKLDYDYSIKRLKKAGLLNSENKLIKATKEKVQKKETTTLAKNLSELEILRQENQQLKNELINKGTTENNLQKSDYNIDFGDYDLLEEKSRKEHYLANREELRYKEEIGELIQKKEMEELLFVLARQIRDTLLQLPKKISVLAMMKKSQKDIENEIQNEIIEILTEFIKSFDKPPHNIRIDFEL